MCDVIKIFMQVKDFTAIKRFSRVMHTVSQVEGTLSVNKSSYDLRRATFPAGMLSDSPEIRSMQIISKPEQTLRGPGGGFSFNGNLGTCMTIRTALIKDGRAYVQAGSGWMHDSTLESEFQEATNKSTSVRNAVAPAESDDRALLARKR